MRTFACVLVGILALLCLVAFPSDAQLDHSSAPATTSPFSENPADSGDHPGVVLGVHLPPVDPSLGPGFLFYWQDIQAFYSIVGRQHPIIMYYSDLTSGLNDYLFDQFRDHFDPSPVPYVQMDPQQDQNLWDIANGQYDAALRQSANAVERFGSPILIGFAHEFNCTHMDYYGDPAAYIAAFRHVRDLFLQEGATNVQWVWPPNYASDRPDLPNSHYSLYYPGDNYVDWIGVYGFNWGTETVWSPGWVSFEYVFHDFLVDTACRYRKPQLVLTASVAGGGSKVEWIQHTYLVAKDYPNLRAFVWFNDYAYGSPSQPDFRITITSAYGDSPGEYPPYTAAYRQAISDPFFLATFPGYDDIEPYTRVCFTVEATSDTHLVEVGGSRTVRVQFDHAPIFNSPVSLDIVDAPPGITYDSNPIYPSATYGEILLHVASWVTPGSCDLTIQAEGGGLQQFDEFTLAVALDLHRSHLPISFKPY